MATERNLATPANAWPPVTTGVRERRSVEAADLEGLHVLVVDDEADTRDLLVEMLTSCKASVSTAASVAEALRAVRERRPDLVVSDIGMPGEDGYGLIKRLRALSAEEGGTVPAVALTAFARAEDRARALVAGFDLHVPKPVDPIELIAELASLVKAPRAGQRRGRPPAS